LINPYQSILDFEKDLAIYCNAPLCVAVNSCTNALLLCVKILVRHFKSRSFEIPKRTYIGVPMSIINAGCKVTFRDEAWSGKYDLRCSLSIPTTIWDCARILTSGMYVPQTLMCLSFHHTKHLAIGSGGAILLDNSYLYENLKTMRRDGREDGAKSSCENITTIGYHCPMHPRDAVDGILRLGVLSKHNINLPNNGYMDLSKDVDWLRLYKQDRGNGLLDDVDRSALK